MFVDDDSSFFPIIEPIQDLYLNSFPYTGLLLQAAIEPIQDLYLN